MKCLLIISGSVAAYKSLELIRSLREAGVECNCILTVGGAEFITPLSVASLSGQPVYTDLFSLKDESEMGHIRLSREADLVVVAPASADLLAKMAAGRADDLASAVLLATNKPVVVVPAMNPEMWQHAATQRNICQLQEDGIEFIGPEAGTVACGETGFGRMSEVATVMEALLSRLQNRQTLKGRHALVTAGPTHEPIDPVRYLGNHSSGKQGYAIAAALAQAGAEVTLVSGPTALPCPTGIHRIMVKTAAEMLKACESALPADIFVGAAAVADWTPRKPATTKLKKRDDNSPPTLALQETADIVQAIGIRTKQRPALVVGFAAETVDSPEALIKAAREKLKRKGCDWVIANDVSGGKIFGADHSSVQWVNARESEAFTASKTAVARWLVERIVTHFIPSKIKAIR